MPGSFPRCRTALMAFLACALWIACAGGEGWSAPDDGPPLRADGWKRAKAALANDSDLRVLPEPPIPPTDYDALHYAIRLTLSFGTQTIAGEVDISVRSLVPQLARLDVDLRQNMAVASVRRGSVPLVFTHSNDRVRIDLDRIFALGDTLTVTVAYSGAPLPEGFGCFRFDTHAGTPVASTLSEPWFARNWWPCKEDPGDKATADLSFTVPVSMTAVSNGSLESNVAHGSTRTFRWVAGYPIATYLVCVAVTNYAAFSDTYVSAMGDSMSVDFYAYPEDLQECQDAWAEEVERLEFFRTIFGEYPFLEEKYGIVEQIRGGIEHQTITGLPPDGLGGSILLSHELAHQWWGDLVTCATWHDIWLNEGIATFASALWRGHEVPGGYAAFLEEIEDLARSEAPVYRTRIDTIGDIFNAAVYERAAWVMHMLRGVVGDSVFFGALLDYRDEYAYASATTSQYQTIVEARAGRSLDWFFEDWIYGAGEPDYEYSWHALPPDEVLVHIEQTQSGRVFRMPLPIAVNSMQGSRRFVLDDTLRSQTFRLRVGGGVTGVELDPDNWVLDTHREVAFPAAVGEAPGERSDRFIIRVAPTLSRGEIRILIAVPHGAERRVRVSIFDSGGRRRGVVAEGIFVPGDHEIRWKGHLPRGIYFVRLDEPAGGRAAATRLVID